jgi:hypothetical protein
MSEPNNALERERKLDKKTRIFQKNLKFLEKAAKII